jgi:hypothetical protein
MKAKERKTIIIELEEHEAFGIKWALEIALAENEDPIAGPHRRYVQNLIDELTALSF